MRGLVLYPEPDAYFILSNFVKLLLLLAYIRVYKSKAKHVNQAKKTNLPQHLPQHFIEYCYI